MLFCCFDKSTGYEESGKISNKTHYAVVFMFCFNSHIFFSQQTACDVSALDFYTITYKVVNGKWNDGTTADKTEEEEPNGHLYSIPDVGTKPNDGYKSGSWSPSTPNGETVITGNTTYTSFVLNGDVTVTAKFKPIDPSPTPAPHTDTNDDTDEERSERAPEPSWTPEKAAATIAAQKAEKQQMEGSQLAATRTRLRSLGIMNLSDKDGIVRNGLDLDMTKADLLDSATTRLFVQNNKYGYNVKITVTGGEGQNTTVKIPAGFDFKPFIKQDGSMNIHEVLWSILSQKNGI